ncbi:unnamed protein product [Mytilus edulis]|uniref:Peptidase C76 domain-containing protein n=1 Tax=Mytilus edulis TaxID=6550 RepID=A0A8S3VLU7_MYTED|nr:unnamed protein product [Mytilus edulis]
MTDPILTKLRQLNRNDFQDLVALGTFSSYENRVFLAGPCNIGKSSLASILIGEEIPKTWISTDGLIIHFGRNGITTATTKDDSVEKRFLKMPRRKNWRAAEAKRGVKNPKKQRLTDLTGDTGPINSTRIDLDMGDTDTLNNSISNNMGDTDLHSNINNSNSNNMGDTDLHTNINNSNLKLLEKSELNKLEISELNILEISELNKLEKSELNKHEQSELNQNSNNNCANQNSNNNCANQNSNNNCANQNSNNNCANQNSDNNCLKETCHIQTDILSNESNNSYAKKDSHCFIQTNLLQDQNEQFKTNSEQGVSKYYNSFNANFIKFGTFDQYATKFADQSRGNQCTCNCLVFLSLSSLNFDSNTLNLDYILNKGDEIYRKHVQELTTQGLFKNMLLNFDEIPVKIEIPEGIFIINKQNILFGIALQYQELTGFLSLQEAIQNCIKQSNKFLIMIGAICSAVYYYNHTYYFFDTHSHSECALNNPLDSSGKSILIGFADLHDLLSYLYAFYTSLQIDLDSQYEILPVCISSKDTDKDVTKQIKNYFEDQKLRNTKQKKVSYQYMKVPKTAEAESKKSQRDNPDIRQMERQRETAAKREVRKDTSYRRAEAENEFMCYVCNRTSSVAQDILEHTIRNHAGPSNFSVRLKVLDESTGRQAYRSLHYGIKISEIKRKIDDGCKPYIDIHQKKISYKRPSKQKESISEQREEVTNETESQTTNSDFFQLLPEVLENLSKIGRLEDFYSVLSAISNGTLLEKYCLSSAFGHRKILF